MIDWNRVIELRDDIGADDFREVVDLFIEEVDEMIEALRKGRDPATLEADMHFLKGSALNLGFSQMSELCAVNEIAAKSNALEQGAVDKALLMYDATKETFLSELPQRLTGS